MVYNYISIKNIIEGIYRDFASQEELDILDVIEWAAEALDLIGATPQFEQPVVDIPVVDHIAELPCGFKSLLQISYEGIAMLPATGTMSPSDGSANTGDTDWIKGEEVTTTNFPLINNQVEYLDGPTYYIDNGRVLTSVETGCITVAYLGLKVDQEGFPMIPDLVQYSKAIKEYCQMMMDRKAWRAQRIPEAVYRDTESKWLSFMKQARAQALMPDLGKMETIKNSWVRLKPRLGEFNNFFSTLGMREMKKIR